MAVFQGTANVTANSANVTNVTGFTLSPLSVFPGAMVSLNGISYVLQSVTNTTTFVLNRPYFGTTATGVRLDINTISENETEIVTLNTRTAALLEEILEQDPLNNLSSISPLTGTGVLFQDATGAHSLVPKADFTQGVDTDGKANTIAQRNSLYGAQVAGFTVLVADTGDGRSAVYFKQTNTLNDWSTPAYLTGPTGATGAPSTIPGIVWRGTYAAGTLYAINDGVTLNGSSFRKLTTAAAGTSPSTAIPPVNTAAWEVLAARGVNGTGTGDVVGPTSSVNNGLVVFSGTTGKLIAAAPNSVVTNALLANMATATIKGRVAAGTGDAQDLTVAQVLTLLDAYSKSNILGTVSQAAGVPTGALFEEGSNANGNYIRLPSGLLFCWADARTASFINQYEITGTWTFPSTFSTTTGLSGTCVVRSNSEMSDAARGKGPFYFGPISTSQGGFGVIGNAGSYSSGQTMVARLFAIGRWF